MESEMLYKRGNVGRSTLVNKPNETMRILIAISVGIMFGFFIGVSFPSLPLRKLNICSTLHDFAFIGNKSMSNTTQTSVNSQSSLTSISNGSSGDQNVKNISKISVPSDPKGAERLPPDIIASESDFYLSRLWSIPSEDLSSKPQYLKE